MKRIPGTGRMKVSADGQGVVSHAGVGMLRELAEHSGLVTGLSEPLMDSYKGYRSTPRGRCSLIWRSRSLTGPPTFQGSRR